MAAALADIGPQLHRPASGSASIGSVAYIGARVLMEGRWGIDFMTDEAVGEPAPLELAQRLEIVVDEAHGDLPADQQPVSVHLETVSGPVEWTVVFEAGHPNRLERDVVLRKFRANAASSLLADERAARIEQTALGLDDLADVRTLTKLLGAS
jgi:2-methylcitrate dehydratase PrpD